MRQRRAIAAGVPATHSGGADQARYRGVYASGLVRWSTCPHLLNALLCARLLRQMTSRGRLE